MLTKINSNTISHKNNVSYKNNDELIIQKYKSELSNIPDFPVINKYIREVSDIKDIITLPFDFSKLKNYEKIFDMYFNFYEYSKYSNKFIVKPEEYMKFINLKRYIKDILTILLNIFFTNIDLSILDKNVNSYFFYIEFLNILKKWNLQLDDIDMSKLSLEMHTLLETEVMLNMDSLSTLKYPNIYTYRQIFTLYHIDTAWINIISDFFYPKISEEKLNNILCCSNDDIAIVKKMKHHREFNIENFYNKKIQKLLDYIDDSYGNVLIVEYDNSIFSSFVKKKYTDKSNITTINVINNIDLLRTIEDMSLDVIILFDIFNKISYKKIKSILEILNKKLKRNIIFIEPYAKSKLDILRGEIIRTILYPKYNDILENCIMIQEETFINLISCYFKLIHADYTDVYTIFKCSK